MPGYWSNYLLRNWKCADRSWLVLVLVMLDLVLNFPGDIVLVEVHARTQVRFICAQHVHKHAHIRAARPYVRMYLCTHVYTHAKMRVHTHARKLTYAQANMRARTRISTMGKERWKSNESTVMLRMDCGGFDLPNITLLSPYYHRSTTVLLPYSQYNNRSDLKYYIDFLCLYLIYQLRCPWCLLAVVDRLRPDEINDLENVVAETKITAEDEGNGKQTIYLTRSRTCSQTAQLTMESCNISKVFACAFFKRMAQILFRGECTLVRRSDYHIKFGIIEYCLILTTSQHFSVRDLIELNI